MQRQDSRGSNWSRNYSEENDPDAYFNIENFLSPTSAAHRLLAQIVLDLINRPPVVANPIADLSLSIEDDPRVINLESSEVFTDEDENPLIYTVTSIVDSVVQARWYAPC